MQTKGAAAHGCSLPRDAPQSQGLRQLGCGPTSCARVRCRGARTAGRVETHAAGAQRHRRIAQVGQWHAGQAHVDRAAFHVQAVLGHAATTRLAQLVVGGRAAVAGDDLEGAPAAELPLHAVQQVEHLRVDRADIAAVVVAQETVQRAQRGGVVLTIDRVDQVDALAGMGVHHRQPARARHRGAGSRRQRGQGARGGQARGVAEEAASGVRIGHGRVRAAAGGPVIFAATRHRAGGRGRRCLRRSGAYRP